MYPPLDSPKPRPIISWFIRYAASNFVKSLSSGGCEENAYPGRLGTITWKAGEVEAARIGIMSKNSTNDPVHDNQLVTRAEVYTSCQMSVPGHPCIRMSGTASGFSEKAPIKWMVYSFPSLFLTGTVYCGNLFISSSCFRLVPISDFHLKLQLNSRTQHTIRSYSPNTLSSPSSIYS